MSANPPANVPGSRLGPLMLSLTGVAVLFLPIVSRWDIVPLQWTTQAFSDLVLPAHPQTWRTWTSGLISLAAPIPFYIAAICLLAQLRCFTNGAWQYAERRVLLCAVVVMAMAVCIWGSLLTKELLGISHSVNPHQPHSYRLAAALGTLFVWGVVPCLLLVVFESQWRRLHDVLFLLALLRLLYVVHVIVWITWSALDSDGLPGFSLGTVLAIVVALGYAREAQTFLKYSRRHSCGTASHTWLRCWLPKNDASPEPGVVRCTDCGYDLRGTFHSGRHICPECGRTAAA